MDLWRMQALFSFIYGIRRQVQPESNVPSDGFPPNWVVSKFFRDEQNFLLEYVVLGATLDPTRSPSLFSMLIVSIPGEACLRPLPL